MHIIKKLIKLIPIVVVMVSGLSFLNTTHARAADTFSLQNVATNLSTPVAMQFAGDGRIFVAEKGGTVKIINIDGTVQTFAKIAVNADYEQGLLGIVLDPNFSSNGFIYVSYTRPDGNFNRISRITVSLDNPSLMQANSEKILLDNIPSPTGIHQMGELQIGVDGTLYASSGDGAIDAQVADNLSSLNGKILRINLDGTIPTDNPFVNTQGARPEIWAYGLRNPFTSAIQPGTGRYFVNDVGQDTWEEINDIQKGNNYGWTTCEGRCNPAKPGLTDPIYQYSHNTGTVVGRAIAGGTWYQGATYPADFVGNYMFGDYVNGWIKRLNPATGQVQDVLSNVPGIVNLKIGPDGLLYMVRLNVTTGSGSISKLNYGSTLPPASKQLKIFAAGSQAGGQYPTMELLINDQVAATYTNVAGNYGQRQFTEYDYNYSGDLNLNQIKINYPNDYMDATADRNLYVDRIELDGQTFQTEADTTFSTGSWSPGTGCAPGKKSTEQLACSGYVQYGVASISQAPVATIQSPAINTSYNATDIINFSGSGSDPKDGTLTPDKLSWNVVFHHDTHTHPFLTFAGTDHGSFTIPDVGEPSANTYYRITLTVINANGNTSSTDRDIFPNKAQITLATNIAGLQLNLDGQPKDTPLTVDNIVNFRRNIEAPLTQTVLGQQYDFVSWSDTGAASHTIIAPSANTTYTATYQLHNQTTPATIIKIYAAGTPADNVYPIMQLLIDGQPVQTFTDIHGDYFKRQFDVYTFTSSQKINPSSIRVSFTNDALINGQDRNLYVDKINLNGQDYESEADLTYSTGTWSADTGCAPGNKHSEALSCGGYFQYGSVVSPTPVQGSKLVVYAAGSPAQGVYPIMAIHVGNQTIATTPDIRGDYTTRQFIRYEYSVPTMITTEPVQVHFINDALINGEDRNLYIDKIEIDGITYEAEAPSIFSIGSWNTANACEGGNKSSEVLSCNGYFEFRK